MRKLSESEEERLIDQVKQYPILYDESYKVADPQDEIWKRIALDLNLDVLDCKTAWKNLRDEFIERNALQEAVNFKYYTRLLFLRDSLQPREGRAGDLASSASPDDMDEEGSPSTSRSSRTMCNTSTPSTSSELMPVRRKRARMYNSYQNLLVNLLSTIQKENKMDAVDSYFFSLSTTVKEFKLLPRDFLKLQCEVSRVIVEKLDEFAATQHNT
ncbi:transcription factor Adf-1-like isoform X2 [Hermetia illucens]|nr:transcription factor Adf-1-like isoform X2 [Hermetia illucens]